jgi:hypothetical protein
MVEMKKFVFLVVFVLVIWAGLAWVIATVDPFGTKFARDVAKDALNIADDQVAVMDKLAELALEQARLNTTYATYEIERAKSEIWLARIGSGVMVIFGAAILYIVWKIYQASKRQARPIPGNDTGKVSNGGGK